MEAAEKRLLDKKGASIQAAAPKVLFTGGKTAPKGSRHPIEDRPSA